MTRRVRKTDSNSYLALNRVKPGTVLIADDGFTCIPDHAQRTVCVDPGDATVSNGAGVLVQVPRNSRSRLYVKCAHGKHFLDGQVSEAGTHGLKFDHYIGFWLKGTEPPKGKNHAAK